MIFSCWATAVLGASLANLPVDPNAGLNPLTTLRITPVQEGLNLSWSDTEDLIKGLITPEELHEGEPLSLDLTVATWQGEPFKGPVTVTLRPVNDLETPPLRQSLIGSPRPLHATLTPPAAGPHRLEIAFTTTRYKVVTAQVDVAGARLPRWLFNASGAALIVMAIALGAWLVLRKGKT